MTPKAPSVQVPVHPFARSWDPAGQPVPTKPKAYFGAEGMVVVRCDLLLTRVDDWRLTAVPVLGQPRHLFLVEPGTTGVTAESSEGRLRIAIPSSQAGDQVDCTSVEAIPSSTVRFSFSDLEPGDRVDVRGCGVDSGAVLDPWFYEDEVDHEPGGTCDFTFRRTRGLARTEVRVPFEGADEVRVAFDGPDARHGTQEEGEQRILEAVRKICLVKSTARPSGEDLERFYLASSVAADPAHRDFFTAAIARTCP